MPRLARCYKVDAGVPSDDLARRVRKAFPGLLVQTADTSVASSERLVEMIGEQTFSAGEAGSPLAKKPEMDLLLRLAGTTQISRAIHEAGVRRGKDFLLVVMGDEPDLVRFESVEAPEWGRLPRRQLDEDDLHRIERAALLNAEKA